MLGTRETDQRAGARAGHPSASRARPAYAPSVGQVPLDRASGGARGRRRARALVRPGPRLQPGPGRTGWGSGRKHRPELVRSCSGIYGTDRSAGFVGAGGFAPGPIRLTRRGRRVRAALIGLAAAVLVGAFVLIATTVASSTVASGGKPLAGVDPAPVRVVLVRPGESVWELAERVDGNRDPRVLVDRIAELNDLPQAGSIQAGERLRIPVAGS